MQAIQLLKQSHQAFELCKIRGWNLLYESLTSYAARDRLQNLESTDLDFYRELVHGKHEPPSVTKKMQKDV
jgi:hypothetical protein